MLIKITQDEALQIVQDYLKKTEVEMFGEVFIDTEPDGEISFCVGIPLESILSVGAIKK